MILVDTSIWVHHLRAGDEALSNALSRSLVCTHPFIVGELACGRMRIALAEGTRIWTRDRRLAGVATELGLSHGSAV